MKIDKRIWYGIPILVGVLLIYKQLKRSKSSASNSDAGQSSGSSAGNGSTVTRDTSMYPLRKGSRNSAVGLLQQFLNTVLACQKKTLLVVDNDFGSKTEAALSSLYGKTSVSSPQEFEALKTKLSAVCSKSSNLSWAWSLIDAQNTGKYNYLMVTRPVKFFKVTKDFTGKWVATSPYLTLELPVRSNYNLNDYVLRSALNDGSLRMEVTKGANAGMWVTVAGTDLKSFNIS